MLNVLPVRLDGRQGSSWLGQDASFHLLHLTLLVLRDNHRRRFQALVGRFREASPNVIKYHSMFML